MDPEVFAFTLGLGSAVTLAGANTFVKAAKDILGGRAVMAFTSAILMLPFVFVAGAGFIAFFIATAWLLGREYFELAAMRFRPPEEAKAMRRENATVIFTAGLIIAGFVSIPIVNLATPLFGMAFMVHMHKRLSGSHPELIEPARRTRVPTV